MMTRMCQGRNGETSAAFCAILFDSLCPRSALCMAALVHGMTPQRHSDRLLTCCFYTLCPDTSILFEASVTGLLQSLRCKENKCPKPFILLELCRPWVKCCGITLSEICFVGLPFACRVRSIICLRNQLLDSTPDLPYDLTLANTLKMDWFPEYSAEKCIFSRCAKWDYTCRADEWRLLWDSTASRHLTKEEDFCFWSELTCLCIVKKALILMFARGFEISQRFYEVPFTTSISCTVSEMHLQPSLPQLQITQVKLWEGHGAGWEGLTPTFSFTKKVFQDLM